MSDPVPPPPPLLPSALKMSAGTKEPEGTSMLPTRLATNGVPSTDPVVLNGIIDTLKARVVELEAAHSKDEVVVQRLTAENEKTQVELLTAKKNLDILQGNVETLKALSIQLACELEEANIQVSTLKEKQAIATMKAERDITGEIENLRREYESRLAEMKSALVAEQESSRTLVDMHRGKEDDAIDRLKRLEADKDALIEDLNQQIEVQRATLQYNEEHRKATSAAMRGGKKGGGYDGTTPSKAAAGSSSHSGAASSSSPFTAVQPSTDPSKTNIIALTVAMNNIDIETTRYIRGVGQLPKYHTDDTQRTRFHVDVCADPSILHPIANKLLNQQNLTSALSGATSGGKPNDGQFCWTFATSLGDELSMTIDVKQRKEMYVGSPTIS